ncbi:MAG TPA: MMPL family transporter, partial [Actinomycetota bacterium]|nr:MMPL family transporter [Actinomycetota bacterium]
MLLGWLVLLAGVVALNASAGGTFRDEFELPGSETQAAIDFLNEKDFSTRAGFSGQIVFQAAGGGVDTPVVRAAMEKLFADIERSVDEASIESPFSPEGRRQIAADETIAYAEVNFGERDSNGYQDASEQIKALVADVDVEGLRIELGGDVFLEEPEFSSEGIGFIAAMIILLIAFGSLLAMGLPLLTAIFGVGSGVALVGLVVNFIDMPSFSTQAVMMIGIGVGIDYALFIVTRYREGLHEGLQPEDAVVRALDTAGRAVLFAGSTVVIAVLGLFVIGLSFVRGLAIGISIGVLMTMLASVTLLPAILGFAGRNIDRLGLPHRRQTKSDDEQRFWFRWSRVIQRRPWPALVLASLFLAVLALPVFAMRLGFGDAGNRPVSDTTRGAYDLLSQGFGAGFNGPLLLAIELPQGIDGDAATLGRLTQELNRTRGVAFATGAIPNAAGDAAIMQVFPATSPQDEATERLVRDLRGEIVPRITEGTGVSVLVGGVTAAVLDFSSFTGERLPLFIAAVLILSFLLLMVVFRSVLVPLKAVLVNLLSISAAYGVLVAVFQWGWG